MTGAPHDQPEVPLHQHDIEAMRRSLVIGGSLTRSDIERLLAECRRLIAERVQIEHILSDLGPAWGGTKRALNELHRILRPLPDRHQRQRR